MATAYDTLLHLYRSLIRSKLDYGRIVYGWRNCGLKSRDINSGRDEHGINGEGHIPSHTTAWEHRELP